MNHKNSELVYSELAEKLNDTIPTSWEKIFLRSEVQKGAIELCYWFIDSKTKEIVQNFEMEKKYGMNRNVELIAFSDLTDIVEKLSNALSAEEHAEFTVFTFILDSDGNFKVDFEYVDLEKSDVIERRKEWKKKYLKG